MHGIVSEVYKPHQVLLAHWLKEPILKCDTMYLQ